MKHWIFAAAVLAGGLFAGEASAQSPVVATGSGCNNCSSGGGYVQGWQHPWATWKHPIHNHPLFKGTASTARMPTLPVYMAAPWYLYWPYDGHFQTVAPMAHGLYYPPPQSYAPANPYMPAAHGGYIPGSPVPNFVR